MILVGNQRGGAKDLAQHLLNARDNERVEVHELSGFMSDTLTGALNEAYAVSRGTKCKQFLFSLSLNPPKDADVSPEAFEKAVDQAGDKLGLTNQPRAIVFHEKKGRDGVMRRHCHAVWSRIDADEMKAVPLPFHKRKLQDVSRDLFLEHGWDMPNGHLNPLERDPLNFSLAEWQQAKRAGKDPKVTKALIQTCWNQSDSKTAFSAALRERGYILAQRDRRGFVAVDYQGEVYAIARSVGIKTKEVGARLGSLEGLPSKQDAQAQAAQIIADRLKTLHKEEEAHQRRTQGRAEAAQLRKAKEQKAETQRLKSEQDSRTQQEKERRESKLRGGLWGLWDRLTGKRAKTLEQNRIEISQSNKRDQEQKQQLAEMQKRDTAAMKERSTRALDVQQSKINELRADIEKLSPQQQEDRARRREEFKARRKPQNQTRRRSRSRDGPKMEP
ncbi:MAG: relaxase [Pseudomonadota bacterium]